MNETTRVSREKTVDGVKAIQTDTTYKFADGTTGTGRSEEVVERTERRPETT
ncbi:MAG: hypothetical protein IPP68_12055 [Elusimicrobia bacterium]|nr:hypothetical protein [Elusimicrobiota bacterium]